ncbi:MAG: hypothetical protein JNK19_11265 [Tabrizicola sp.]|nr:hypothetical protein [Tabrizicola sp.]
MNTTLLPVIDADGRPIRFFMTKGEFTDHTGAAAPLDSLPRADFCWLTGVVMLPCSDIR